MTKPQLPNHKHTFYNTLLLNTQACLAGNPKAGSFVRVYLTHGSSLPTWHKPRGSNKQCIPEATVLTSVSILNHYMCTRFVELSQRALQMRKDVDMGRGSIAEHRASVTRFRDELCSSWKPRYPAFLPRDSPEAGARLPTLSRTIFDLVSFPFLAVFSLPPLAQATCSPHRRTYTENL